MSCVGRTGAQTPDAVKRQGQGRGSVMAGDMRAERESDRSHLDIKGRLERQRGRGQDPQPSLSWAY